MPFLNRQWKRYSCLLLLVMLSLSYWLAGWSAVARAEGFVDPAFQAQWNQTDLAVAKQGANRTYFWGPSPFAHTSEVYAEGSKGQRQVQYFDKARMELSRRPGQDPNFVTNGLLTVELVTGRLQVGDNQFLPRQAATNPVAGDQLGNDLTPTYTSFNQGRLAFGVPGHQAAADRSGQPIAEAVNRLGQVSGLAQPPVSLKYARYFGETGHNVADVFYNFFQTDPLGPDKWLSVMGLPIAEPFWAQDKVVVAGQPRDVLIQLFQRRALTYTPSNPNGFQVEMSNIGQHYYVWRYGFDTRDVLPGNYQAIIPQDNNLYSVDLRQPTSRFKVGSTPSGKPITGLYALNEGRAVIADDSATYLADLTKARAFTTITPPAGMTKPILTQVAASPDGHQIALAFKSSQPAKVVVQLYGVDTLSGDNLKINSSASLVQINQDSEPLPLKFSADSAYLILGLNFFGDTSHSELHLENLSNRTEQVISFSDTYQRSLDYNWFGRSNELLYSVAGIQTGGRNIAGTVSRLDATTGNHTELLSNFNIRHTLPSPDGNYFALSEFKQDKGDSYYGTSIVSAITFRSVANPAMPLVPEWEQTSSFGSASNAVLDGWSADGTYLAVYNSTSIHPGGANLNVNVLSLISGQPLHSEVLQSNYNSYHSFRLAGPFYSLNAWFDYEGPSNPLKRTVTIQNLDGSDSALVFDALANSDSAVNRTPLILAQVVQVPKI